MHAIIIILMNEKTQSMIKYYMQLFRVNVLMTSISEVLKEKMHCKFN